MQLTMNDCRGHAARVSAMAALVAAILLTISSPGLADSAYIPQINGNLGSSNPSAPNPGSSLEYTVVSPGPIDRGPSTPAFAPPPEATVPAGSGPNTAGTLVVGNYNGVAQLQAGVNDRSAVGVVGGENHVGVLQLGNNLRSNIGVIGSPGVNVGVIQPPGSPPVNLLVLRLPNGGLLIAR
jgi:hypothetical protein